MIRFPDRETRIRSRREKTIERAFLAALHKYETPPVSVDLREGVMTHLTPPHDVTFTGSPAGMCADRGAAKQ